MDLVFQPDVAAFGALGVAVGWVAARILDRLLRRRFAKKYMASSNIPVGVLLALDDNGVATVAIGGSHDRSRN